MPVDMSKYPPEWPQIRERILERAKHQCERCSLPNHAWVVRGGADGEDGSVLLYTHAEYQERDRIWHAWQEDEDGICSEIDEFDPAIEPRPIRIVLTIAHVNDPDPQNCADDNLQALCQRCHNRLDAPMRARNAAKTRRQKMLTATGQQELAL